MVRLKRKMSASSTAGSPEPWKHRLSSVEGYPSVLENKTYIKRGKVNVAERKLENHFLCFSSDHHVVGRSTGKKCTILYLLWTFTVSSDELGVISLKQ